MALFYAIFAQYLLADSLFIFFYEKIIQIQRITNLRITNKQNKAINKLTKLYCDESQWFNGQ